MSNPDVVVESDSALQQYTVIVVDDEQNVLKSLQRLFRREEYRFICAGSGAEGLKLITETAHVAVIISDQRMPEMNGSEFLARSREYAPDAVRMLLTGYSDMETTVAAMNEGGATRYISKPWEDSVLLQTVREGVRQYHLQQENQRQQGSLSIQNDALTDMLQLLTEQKKELERLATRDSLTGLTNRRSLLESLGNECLRSHRYDSPLSLIMMDIDHFKGINDRFGHSVGDDVLINISHDINRAIRTVDIACRYDGDEFVILLPETDLPEAVLSATRLQQNIIDTPLEVGLASPILVTVSMGVVMLAKGEDEGRFIERADLAMYRAKNCGRNRIEVSR
jgi:diguanylate cyclase (GGDEF)-like protein